MGLFSREEVVEELRKAKRKIFWTVVYLFLCFVLPWILNAIDPGHNQRIADGIKAKQREAANEATKNKH